MESLRADELANGQVRPVLYPDRRLPEIAVFAAGAKREVRGEFRGNRQEPPEFCEHTGVSERMCR